CKFCAIQIQPRFPSEKRK
ncbi:unnamed protein product, partial [Allacma fusca]